MASKDFKTVDEQIALLKSRGLIIDDEEQAKDFLLKNNYYRVSGYSLTLRSHDVFYPTATFKKICDIYYFDHKLRHILLKYLEQIEVTIKSVYAHEFARLYGSDGYLDKSHFSDEVCYQKTMEKAEQQKESRHAHEAYLKHFIDDLHGTIPFWAYVDLFTITDISFLYSISDKNVQTRVANAIGLTSSVNILGPFLHSMTILRNLCAHGSRLYNRLFEQKPKLKKEEFNLLNTRQNGEKDNSHLFSFILIMRRLLSEKDFDDMKNEISALNKEYPFVKMRYYGFCDEWESRI